MNVSPRSDLISPAFLLVVPGSVERGGHWPAVNVKVGKFGTFAQPGGGSHEIAFDSVFSMTAFFFYHHPVPLLLCICIGEF